MFFVGRAQTRSQRVKFKFNPKTSGTLDPSATSSSHTISTVVPDEELSDPAEGALEEDRWDYTCLVCKLGGEMLCCEVSIACRSLC